MNQTKTKSGWWHQHASRQSNVTATEEYKAKLRAITQQERDREELERMNQTKTAAAKFKEIDYAMPTSINAKQFGFEHAGCYVVKLSKGIIPAKTIAGFATKAEAYDYAESLPNEWSNMWIRHYKKFIDRMT